MGFKPITINTEASEPAHILAQDDATLYNHIVGADCVLDVGSHMEASIIDNNTVRIGDGAVIVQGHLGRTPYGEYDDMIIENGTAGQKRHDLIVARFQTTAGIDTFELAVIKGTPGVTATDPVITVGDLSQGDSIREYVLYRVKLDGLSITAVEKMYSVGMTIESLRQAHTSHLAESAKRHITDSGSNDDGFYIKFDDGTMICWGFIGATVFNASQHGALYRSDVYRHNYPQTFAGSLFPSTAISAGSPGNYGIWVIAGSDSMSSIVYRAFGTGSEINGKDTGALRFLAIGRWK